jgi:hypothetical protein
MNAPLTNGHADVEPWTYADKRLRTAGRVISLADDKLAALTDLAGGFAGDVREGLLSHGEVVDRLQEVADAYGLIAEHGENVIQRTVAGGFDDLGPVGDEWKQPPRSAKGPPPRATLATAAALRTKTFDPIKYIVPGYIAEGCTILAGRPKLGKSSRAGRLRLHARDFPAPIFLDEVDLDRGDGAACDGNVLDSDTQKPLVRSSVGVRERQPERRVFFFLRGALSRLLIVSSGLW